MKRRTEPAPRIGPRIGPRDLFGECLASLLARPGRALLTVLGTVVGVAALVATLGLSKTAGNQIVGRFSETDATDVSASPKVGHSGMPAESNNSTGKLLSNEPSTMSLSLSLTGTKKNGILMLMRTASATSRSSGAIP